MAVIRKSKKRNNSGKKTKKVRGGGWWGKKSKVTRSKNSSKKAKEPTVQLTPNALYGLSEPNVTRIPNPLYGVPTQPVTQIPNALYGLSEPNVKLTTNPLYKSSGTLQHTNIKEKQQRLLALREILQNPTKYSKQVLTQSSAEANTIRRQLANVMHNNFMGQLTPNVARNKPASNATSTGTYSGANFYSVGIAASPTPNASLSRENFKRKGLGPKGRKPNAENPSNNLNLIRTSTNKTNKQSLLNAHYRIVHEPTPYKNINSVHNAQKIIDFLTYKSKYNRLNNTDQQLASNARAYIIRDKALLGKMRNKFAGIGNSENSYGESTPPPEI